MVDSGVRLTQEAKNAITNIAEKKTGRKAEYLTLHITKSGKKDAVDLCHHPEAYAVPSKDLSHDELTACHKKSWNDFVADLTGPDEKGVSHPRFGVAYIRHGTSEKLVFIYWCPENAPVKERMVYSSTKETVKKVVSFNFIFERDDLEDLTYENTVKET